MDLNFKQLRKTNPQAAERINKHKCNLQNRFGLTPEGYAALLASQGGTCAICLSFPMEDGRNLGVDHKHAQKDGAKKSDMNRGLLCHRCNVGIGFFRDSPALLRAAANYIEEWEVKHEQTRPAA